MQTELFNHTSSLHDTHKFLHSIYAFRPNQSPQIEFINSIFEGYNSDDEILESCEMANCIYIKVYSQNELNNAIQQHQTTPKRIRFLVAFRG